MSLQCATLPLFQFPERSDVTTATRYSFAGKVHIVAPAGLAHGFVTAMTIDDVRGVVVTAVWTPHALTRLFAAVALGAILVQ